MHDGVPLRRYAPEVRSAGTALAFLHGGYGLFGDLDLQDGYCRRLAEALGVVVLVELDGAEHGFAGTERVTEALAAFGELTRS